METKKKIEKPRSRKMKKIVYLELARINMADISRARIDASKMRGPIV